MTQIEPILLSPEQALWHVFRDPPHMPGQGQPSTPTMPGNVPAVAELAPSHLLK